MSKAILLSTLTATYQHASLGLRYLYANLDELQQQAQIKEFTTNVQPREIAEKVLALNPKIVGFGVYIWNTKQTCEVISILKKVAPELIVVIGGPEVSYESEAQEISKLADYVVKGEADFLFRDLCRDLLANVPRDKFVSATNPPEISLIKSPYSFYDENDIKNRVIYVEASRGCPYKCEYCLSSLDKSVRNFEIDLFLQDMQMLIDKGVTQFKFIDRTFNLSITTCSKILNFFIGHLDKNLFLHFEMVPDRLPDELRDLISKFPKGSLQFEVGIQTLNPEVAKAISRRNDMTKVAANFDFLVRQSGVHIHADLIVGLPGEDIKSFGEGFDQLRKWGPDEIQVGILKRLKGTPIVRHDSVHGMVYSDHPPFQILKTKAVNFEQMQIMVRFAKYWDLFANSGNFPTLMKFFSDQSEHKNQSFFWLFYDFSLYLSEKHGEGIAVSMINLTQTAMKYLVEKMTLSEEQAREILFEDYVVKGKRDSPSFLRMKVKEGESDSSRSDFVRRAQGSSTNKRQAKHLGHENLN